MFLAVDDTPLVLQGPQPQIPASGWEAYGWVSIGVLVLGALLVYGLVRIVRRRAPALTPLVQLERALQAAEALPTSAALVTVTQALRNYLAAIEPKAATSLATDELITVLAGTPLFLPARQPLGAALRAADAAKFADAPLELPLLIAGIREAARRIDHARETFARAAVAPLIKSTPKPIPGVPPLPAHLPPPLPPRNHA